ncbi:hypothetical protein PV413_23830 [Streptomyces scabiei]|uniref:hypothetical protein n=1 Tax=Streptomyces scabiei TaxID=1930 RepID=UPI0029A3448A|nr:hypothetical protein [Streptomyces scabiei]MDX2566057.1 hypothetical protein [Streptomyces scabiei]MDX3150459.1 hypothetical protein [Streptomyces scabiei]MDX3288097.1 hypothetical protein [Streptomyces scabiei]
MSAVDQHAEAHRLKAEHGYGARRIGQELGISRHAATQLLARPLPQPVAATAPVSAAGVAEERPPVAEPVAGVAATRRPVAEPVAEGVVVAAAPVGHMTGAVQFPRPDARSPWLRVDLSRRRGLLRDLVALTRVGLRIPYVVEDVLRAFAAAYHQALSAGRLQRGQGYEVQITVRPCRHA